MIDSKEALNTIAELLNTLAKLGPDKSNQIEKTREQISQIVLSTVISTGDATSNYKKGCEEFLDKVILAKGMPFSAIGGSGEIPSNAGSSGQRMSDRFDLLLPKIKKRCDWCIENYRSQSNEYFDRQFKQVTTLIDDFLNNFPEKAKDRSSKVSEIKKEIRYLTKWNRLFNIYKAASFPAEIKYILAFENEPIAAVWCYSNLDEQGEYEMSYDHKVRDKRTYAVRGNWAIKKGLMSAGPDGYIDDIDRPGKQVGCMCSLTWITSMNDLPKNMVER
jgi:hypothetical protein